MSKQPKSAYSFDNITEKKKRHIFSILVDNEPGVLAKVIGLFAGRGYNIISLTVSPISFDKQTSRISIVTRGTSKVIKQMKAQLKRIIPVHEVHDLTVEGEVIEREVALIRLAAKGKNRTEAIRIANIFGAKVEDTTLTSFVFQLSGRSRKVSRFIELMRPLGALKVSRSGVVAIERNK